MDCPDCKIRMIEQGTNNIIYGCMYCHLEIQKDNIVRFHPYKLSNDPNLEEEFIQHYFSMPCQKCQKVLLPEIFNEIKGKRYMRYYCDRCKEYKIQEPENV